MLHGFEVGSSFHTFSLGVHILLAMSCASKEPPCGEKTAHTVLPDREPTQ